MQPCPPGLNAIEKVWRYLRERYLSGRPQFRRTRTIVDACCAAWNNLIAETGRIRSLTDRVSAQPLTHQSPGLTFSVNVLDREYQARGAAAMAAGRWRRLPARASATSLPRNSTAPVNQTIAARIAGSGWPWLIAI